MVFEPARPYHCFVTRPQGTLKTTWTRTKILQRAGRLPASHAEDGQALEAGRILVAPPDRHLMVEDGRVRVVRGPRENLHRPAIDPLFRSAATAYGPGAIAVVLSGARTDGAAGAAAVSECGGAVLVQDPEEAAYPDMPRSAITADQPDYVLPLAEIPATISRLAMEPLGETLLGAQTQNLDPALFVALRALEERGKLPKRVRERLSAKGNEASASRYDEVIQESERNANFIRAVLAGQSEAA